MFMWRDGDGDGGARGLLVGVLPALLGVGVGHEPRVAVDADGLVRGRGRRPRAPAALLGPAPRHLRLLVDEVVGAPEEARPVLGAARVARDVELDEVLRAMRNWTNDRVSEALFEREMVGSMVGMKMATRWWEDERIALFLRISHPKLCASMLLC